jgi:hypothetical protein
MRKPILLLALSILTCNTGCASMETYFKDRALDFVDCFKVDAGYGSGIAVYAKATELFSTGFGWGIMWKYGLKGRNIGHWNDIHLGWPASIFTVAPYLDNNEEIESCDAFLEYGLNVVSAAFIGVLPESYSKAHEKPCKSPYRQYQIINGGYFALSAIVINTDYFMPPDGKFNNYRPRPITAFDIEAGVFAGFVGVHVGVSPGQLADFLLGWFGVDIAGDDTGSIEAPEKNGNKTNDK